MGGVPSSCLMFLIKSFYASREPHLKALWSLNFNKWSTVPSASTTGVFLTFNQNFRRVRLECMAFKFYSSGTLQPCVIWVYIL
jgi:hypothetical protein